MNKTKQEKWQRAYGDTPDSFRQRVAASLPKGQEARHVAFPRRAAVLATVLVLVLTTAYAAVVTHTELVWNAGHPIENEADDRCRMVSTPRRMGSCSRLPSSLRMKVCSWSRWKLTWSMKCV